jgi:AraC family transcriptional regulator
MSSPLVVDFVQEKEAAYQRIFSRSPLFSSIAANWDGMLIAYDDFQPGQMVETCSRQHGIGIFIEMPDPADTERWIDQKLRREQVLEGDVVIVPANTCHQSCWDRAGKAIMLGIDPQNLAQTIDEILERDRIELIPHFATPDPLMHQIGLALKRALTDNRAVTSRLYAESLVTTMTAHLLQYYCNWQSGLPSYTGGLSKLKLNRVINYIQTYLDRDLSLKELAAIAQISSHYFVQLFKQSTGFTPHQYVIYCRVERAKELLKRKDLSIAEVARIVGFVDQSHFHRHFKRLVGMTPKAFQQQF